MLFLCGGWSLSWRINGLLRNCERFSVVVSSISLYPLQPICRSWKWIQFNCTVCGYSSASVFDSKLGTRRTITMLWLTRWDRLLSFTSAKEVMFFKFCFCFLVSLSAGLSTELWVHFVIFLEGVDPGTKWSLRFCGMFQHKRISHFSDTFHLLHLPGYVRLRN